MMKTLINIKILTIVLVISQVFCACDDWVDVQPETNVSLEDQFSTAEGFEEVIYGLYIAMGSETLYGHQLTYGWIEKLAKNHYQNVDGKWFAYQYEDEGVKSSIRETWKSMYNVIANANTVIDNIDDKKNLFNEQEFNVLKGEALIVRAFMHFDLYRLFGKSYLLDPESLAIPYADQYGAFVFKHLKAKEVIDRIIADLNAAEELMKGHDPIIDEIENEESNAFLILRDYRFNYYSIHALKARVYNYIGDKENSLLFAKKVIDDANWTWAGSSGSGIFSSEVLSKIGVSALPSLYDQYFKNDVYITTNDSDNHISVMYEVADYDNKPGIGALDYRYANQFVNNSEYIKARSSKYLEQKTIPLFRVGECYLIAAEASLPNKEKSVEFLNELRLHRGIIDEVSSDLSEDDIQKEIVKEIRKELYLEGQTFYAYKRLNMTTIPQLDAWEPYVEIEEELFSLPIPTSELELGNIED